MKERIDAARQAYRELGFDAFLITSEANWRYLTQFTGDFGYLVVTPRRAALVTVGNYMEQAAAEVQAAEVLRWGPPHYGALKDVLAGEGLTSLAIEADEMRVAEVERLRAALDGVAIALAENVVRTLRAVKDDGEIALLRQAAAIADVALRETLPLLQAGTEEAQFALELEYRMRQLGSAGVSFPTIAVSGVKGSLPHGVPSRRTVGPGEFMTVDWGAVWQGYHSDCTRTFAIGDVDAEHRAMYDAVSEALAAATAAAGPGVPVADIDRAARDVITDAGLGIHFVHAVGHGVGLEIHEEPLLSQHSDQVLQPGMVITVEPGVYIPGTGGVRIEDTLLITADGAEVLTGLSKNLEIR